MAHCRYNLRNAHNYEQEQSILTINSTSLEQFTTRRKTIKYSKLFQALSKKDILPIPRYYYDHVNRKHQIHVLHSRLRTGCSALNLDLFTKYITDSPLCSCGRIENSQHNFSHFRNYQAIRYELLNGNRYIFNSKIVREYDQEIPQSQTADNPVRKSRSTTTRHQEDKLSKAISSLFPIKMIAILEWT